MWPSAQGGLSPEGKHARVRALQDQGAVVAMVGDGVNDAPVLAQAQLSIAMGSGAVLSQAHSDLVLLEGRLAGLLDAFAVSRPDDARRAPEPVLGGGVQRRLRCRLPSPATSPPGWPGSGWG